jgi:fermentation-respiration switch protein FrsA (DUF1100 family)
MEPRVRPVLAALGLAVLAVVLNPGPCAALDWNYPAYPSDLDPPLAYQRLVITTTDSVRIAAWYVPPADTGKGRRPAVLVLPREGEILSDRLASIAALSGAGFAVLAFDHRGAGASEAFAFEGDALLFPEYVIDAASALDILWTRPEVDTVRIALYGESAGAMTAFALVRDRAEPRGLVAVSVPYDVKSWTETREELRIEPMSPAAGGWRRKDDPDKVVRRYNGAILFIVGTADRETPPSMAQKLFEAYPHPKDLWEVPEASHTPPHTPRETAGAEYWSRVTGFLLEELAAPPHRSWPDR